MSSATAGVAAAAEVIDERELRRLVERFAAEERPSGSAGERRAAELLAEELAARGARVRLEEESVHGTYWWPVGLLAAVGCLAALSRRRSAALAAAAAAWGAADEISGAGGQRFRRLLRRRSTTNLVAEASGLGAANRPQTARLGGGGTPPPNGDAEAALTVVFVAHHDAAHSGLVFHPELPRAVGRRFPALLERARTTPPTMWGAVLGPALAAIGALTRWRALRAAGAVLSAGYAAAMADIGARRVVPGANDNATGMAVLVALADGLRGEPPPGVRVLLVSTGSEESFMEGMRAFARRHFAELPRESTLFFCIDTVGSPRLLLLESEGMLRLHPYPEDVRRLVRECADELGVSMHTELRFHNATDAVIALRQGYRSAMLGSVDEFKIPTDYHWPTDTPDRVNYGTVRDAARLCLATVRRVAATGIPTG